MLRVTSNTSCLSIQFRNVRAQLSCEHASHAEQEECQNPNARVNNIWQRQVVSKATPKRKTAMSVKATGKDV
eukprot:1552427-Amphidinium_carterae.1